MPNSNVTIVGNLVADPELRLTNSAPLANFTVAVNEGTKETPRTSFFDVTAWRSLGENVVQSLHKGQRVIVTGTLNQRSWDQDGQKRSKVEITAESVGPDLRWAVADVVKVTENARPAAQQHYTAPQHVGAEINRIKAGLRAQEEPQYTGEPF